MLNDESKWNNRRWLKNIHFGEVKFTFLLNLLWVSVYWRMALIFLYCFSKHLHYSKGEYEFIINAFSYLYISSIPKQKLNFSYLLLLRLRQVMNVLN